MRLLFNASNLKSSGGLVILEQLLPAFLAYEAETGQNDFTWPSASSAQGNIDSLLLYHHPDVTPQVKAWIEALPTAAQGRIEAIPFREPDGLRRFYWEQVTLPRIIQLRQVDVLFSFGNTGPLRPGCRQILYLQQSIPYTQYQPRNHWLKWIRFQWMYGFLINLAQLGSQRIVVPTRWLVQPMREAIVFRKPASAYRVSLPGLPGWPNDSPNGGQRAISAAEQALLDTLSMSRKMGTRILLYPCNLAPYKNIMALLEAVHILNTQMQHFQLILTFNEASAEYFPCKQAILTAVAQCPANRVVLAGSFSRAGLRQLYGLTDVLVFPSLVETLGLPLMEAMALGIPVVALDGRTVSDRSTLAAFARDICGDAAIYAPPGQTSVLASQIHQVLRDLTLALRLGQAGLQRAGSFSWEQHVRDILGP